MKIKYQNGFDEKVSKFKIDQKITKIEDMDSTGYSPGWFISKKYQFDEMKQNHELGIAEKKEKLTG